MEKRVFITGISGFAGSHLTELLVVRKDIEIYGTVFGEANNIVGIPEDHLFRLNLLDRDNTLKTLQAVQPHWIFHLAALSSPAASFKDPRGTMTNNIEAEINVLDGARQVKDLEKILVVGSAEEYGKVRATDLPIDEETALNPLNPYAVSKIAQDYLGLQYFLVYQLPVVRVRPFNHTGTRQAPLFVVPAFAQQIAAIEAGKQPPVLHVGNLEACRDFTDVSDMVHAYVLALEHGLPGDVYNIGTGKSIKIAAILQSLLQMAKVTITVQPDPDRMMPSDVPDLVCNAQKFKTLTGWEPTVALHDTLQHVLDYWRQQ